MMDGQQVPFTCVILQESYSKTTKPRVVKGPLSRYFSHVQNYLYFEGNLKIIVY